MRGPVIDRAGRATAKKRPEGRFFVGILCVARTNEDDIRSDGSLAAGFRPWMERSRMVRLLPQCLEGQAQWEIAFSFFTVPTGPTAWASGWRNTSSTGLLRAATMSN